MLCPAIPGTGGRGYFLFNCVKLFIIYSRVNASMAVSAHSPSTDWALLALSLGVPVAASVLAAFGLVALRSERCARLARGER